jgi:hypothetical protein
MSIVGGNPNLRSCSGWKEQQPDADDQDAGDISQLESLKMMREDRYRGRHPIEQ